MTGFQPSETLRQHRPLLLACEAIGWLHMAGKAKSDFLRGHGGQTNNYKYEKWHEHENPPFPWDNLLQWVRNTSGLGNTWPGTFTEFLTKHAGRNAGMLGLLQAGHGMVSSIEKNLPKPTSDYLGQDVTHMWLSSAFGHPVRNLLDDPPAVLAQGGWDSLLKKITCLLTALQGLGGTPNDLDGWWNWREGAIGAEPPGRLRKAFTSTLAETRLPNNDVTLFDQSYVAAALFKSAVAGAVLEGSSFPWKIKDKKNGKEKPNDSLKQQTLWRLLTIGAGVDHYEARAVKIGDWTGARLALDAFFKKVRNLVEVDLAAGSLLYRDAGICVFSFPGERQGPQGHSGSDLQIQNWKKWLEEQIDSYARDASLELPPYCGISDKSSRSLVGMTKEIRKARETMAVPLHRNWTIPGPDTPGGHVCPVCLVRGNGQGTDKQKPCKPCKDRRIRRLDRWREGKLDSDSIWISEVADAQDRLALITMSLDIEPWLDGTRLDALRTQSVATWAANNTTANKPLPGDQNTLVSLFGTALGRGNQAGKAKSLIQKKIAPGLKDENNSDVPWDTFFRAIVEDRADARAWNSLDDNTRARWLAHQLFCKLASPGRIYRFERQAEEFFKAMLDEFREIAAADPNRWRTRRLVIKPDNGSSNSWQDRQTYNGRREDSPVSLLYRKETEGFLTICNLARLLKPEDDKDALCGITLDLKTDDDETTWQLKIRSAGDHTDRLGVYHPVIPLELSPVRFRVLVPLDAASNCVDRAVQAWNREFSRVWDRLPLRVGVVAFPRMVPFQAVIEAARNIEEALDRPGAPETWRVEEAETREGVTALSLKSLDGKLEMLRTMPIHLPGGREDVFYPYLAVEGPQVRESLDFQHPCGQVYRHAKDLKSGDGIFIYPSRIATVFMDSAARRFEPVRPVPLSEWQWTRDLWKLVDRSVPGQTALRGAWSELAGQRGAWQGPDGEWLEGGRTAWLDLARAVFHTRLGVRGACLETLAHAAGDGSLDRCLEWHISVLKQRVSGGDK
jgi:hypothetical protein